MYASVSRTQNIISATRETIRLQDPTQRHLLLQAHMQTENYTNYSENDKMNGTNVISKECLTLKNDTKENKDTSDNRSSRFESLKEFSWALESMEQQLKTLLMLRDSHPPSPSLVSTNCTDFIEKDNKTLHESIEAKYNVSSKQIIFCFPFKLF